MLNEIVPVDHELWMRDSNTKTCLICEASFTTFRRRHHCRYCGLIFCSKCTLKNKYLTEGQKLSRICIKCYNSLVSKRMNSTSIGQNTPEIQSAGVNSFHKDQKPDSGSSTDDDLSVNRVFTVSNDIPHEVELMLNEMNHNSKWDESCDDYLKIRTQELLNEHKLSLEWGDIILNVVKNSVKVVCPTVQYRGDYMNISRYIKFQKVTWTDSQLSAFFNGVAFSKNLAHKKMLKSIQNPKILLIKEIIEGGITEKALISMDKLIDQEMSLTNITLKKILSIGPKVIMCNKGLPQQFLNDLAKSNISALINVKKSLMDTVARATQGKVLNNTDEIHHERNFIGQCKSFFIENRGETSLVHFSGLNDPSLIGSILLSAPDPTQLKLVKEIIRQLLVEYRSVRIEKGIFENFQVNSKSNAFYELKSQSFSFKHIVISENKMCIKPDSVIVEFYNQKDMALGEFITIAANKVEQKCSDCNNAWGAHTLYYIKNDTRIKIVFSKWNIENKSTDIYVTKECKECGKIDSPAILLQKSIWEYSFFKFLSNFIKKTSITFNGIKCKHPFFPTSKFIFHVKTLKIIISSEENQLFNIVACSFPDQTEYFNEILKNSLEELKIYTSSFIDKILLKYKDTCGQVIKEMSDEKVKNQEIILDLMNSIEKVNSRSLALNDEINELKSEQFENYLQVESMRKKVFFKILEIRKAMIDSLPIVQRNRRRERILLDTVSSSGESSGDRRLSPSPTPSFIEDETGQRIRKESTASRNIYRKGYEEILQQPEYIYLQKGNLTLGTGINDQVIPVIEADLMSILAYALNSVEYHEQVLNTIPNSKDTDKIESILLTPNENHFQLQFTTCDDDYFKDLAGKETLNIVYGGYTTFNVHIFFPKQFQVIRDKILYPHLQFIMGLFSTQSKKEQLGKSKASFFKSNNNLYILKVVDEKEFQMFKELAPNYFKHFCNSEFHNMPGLMARTLGCFRVYIKSHTKGKSKCKWVLLSENLGFNMPKEVEIYDLKGSFNHRRMANIKEKQTKMDRNFLEDFGGLPLMISKEAKKIIEIASWNDSLFLSKNNVVDYSLLLIISKQNSTLTMGIIDYIAKYTFEKAIEHKYKKVVGTDNPTITRPAMYKSRFRESISNFFFIEWED